MNLREKARALRGRVDDSMAAASAAWDVLVVAKQTLADAEIPEGKSLTDLPAYEAANKAKAAYDEAADAHRALDGEYKAVLELLGTEAPEAPAVISARGDKAQSIGEAFTTSDVYTDLRARIPESASSKAQIGTTGSVPVANRDQARSLMTPRGAVFSTPDNIIAPDQATGIRPLPLLPALNVLDYITMASTDSTSVKWIREASFTNNAAETAETTEATKATNMKPESALSLEPVTFEVQTIAHWMPVSKQSLRDVAGLSSLIDAKLLWGLRRRLARQIMIGDGLSGNLLGITNTTGIGSVTASGLTAMHLIEDLYDACTSVVDNYGEQPNVGFVSRADYKKLRFARDSRVSLASGDGTAFTTEDTGGFIFGPPTSATPIEIEGTLILPNPDVTTPIVGVFREYAVWMHEGIGVSASDSHSDYFTRNLVAILAEFAAAAGAMETVAFCEIATA